MKTVEEFVESALNYMSAKDSFTEELIRTLKIPPKNVKYIELKASTNGTTFNHIIVIHLVGENSFKSEDIAKIDGLTIKTPNTLEIEYGEIKL